MRRVFGLCVGISLAAGMVWPVRAQEAPAVKRLTEAEALALLPADPRLRASRARIDETRAVHDERVRWPNPSATYARESVFGATDLFLSARQELPITGRRGALASAGRAAVAAAEAGARQDLAALQADLRHAFTALMLAQERQLVLRGAVEGWRQLVGILRTREELGEGSTFDRLRGERALIDLEAELAAADAARVAAQGRLAAALGQPLAPETLVAADRLAPPPAPPPVAPLVEQALAARGDYQAARLAVEQVAAEQQAARKLVLPTPTLGGGLKRSGTGAATHNGYHWSLDVNVPLFNRGRPAVALAMAQGARAEAELAFARLQVEAEVRGAHAVLAVLQPRAIRYRDAVAGTAEPLARVGRVAYEEGELGILELLDAERQAIDARLHVLEHDAAARRAAIELDRATGREMQP